MANNIININRRNYVVGMIWQPMMAGFTVRNYARNLSKNIDKKLNLYTEYRMLIGVVSSRCGAHAGMLSAAAEVMESFVEYTSFLAVFSIEKRFYMVAARNGIILADKIFDSEREAREEYVKMSEIPEWGAFFAPGAWGMPRAAERNLADLLTGRAHSVLHSISRFRARVFSVFVLVAFLMALGGVFKDSVKQTFAPRPQVTELNPELVAEYKRQIEEKEKELDEQFEIEKTPPPEPIVMPYEILPDPMERAWQCYQAVAFLMQSVSGWNQSNVVCGEGYAEAEFVRDFGTLDEFYNVLYGLMPGALVSEVNEDLLKVRVALPKLDVYSSQDERDADTVVRDVVSAFQGIDTSVDVNVTVDTLTNGVDVASVDVVEVGVVSKLTPQQFMKIFEEFGGTYLVRVSWNVRARSWNYEVLIYAK